MSLRQLPLRELDWQLPATPVIDAVVLDAQLRHDSAVRHAERETSVILKSASRKAEQIVRAAYKKQRQMHITTQETCVRQQQQMLLDCEARWLETHVVSLREDAALEKHIIQAVSTRIHDCIEQVLTAWLGQQPVDDILCNHLTARVVQMADEGGLQLHVHPEMATVAQDKFGQQLTVNVDSSLARDEAVLASSQLSLTLSPRRHFRSLLRWLRTPVEGVSHPENALFTAGGSVDGEE